MTEDTTQGSGQAVGEQPTAKITYNGNVYEYYGDKEGLEAWLKQLFTQSL